MPFDQRQRLPILLLPLVALLLAAPAAHAQAVGSVQDLRGTLVSRGADGVSRVLALNSPVREGDTLSTERNSYARVVFKDDADITLQPGSVLVVTRYAYDADKPQQDKVELGLAQGAMRSNIGKLARRSTEATVIQTPMGVLKGSASMVVSLDPNAH
ncbi:hypothetical protein SRS16P3_00099 (plasmid) [Variovorax sp. SRS16]|uniref:FecR domain-containing protein n=1 Tax=Variovorax sp. SRS16 TaxID=282217 RepID=UPI00131743D8|nr:FecR domain-containing protein [Variovorax sp. SRS16]VTU46387.1 hypothetical protein SRS16P3_00099 [Variovorax sp. SRS16]